MPEEGTVLSLTPLDDAVKLSAFYCPQPRKISR
jgi:hypothetical protein